MLLDYRSLMLTIVGAALLLVLMSFRRRGRDILFLIAVYYCYFAFGPVVNVLLDNPIFAGTIQSMIPEAAIIFILAMSGLFLVSVVTRSRSAFDMTRVNDTLFAMPLCLMSVGATFVTIAMVASKGTALLGSDKLAKIAIVGPNIHYRYLLVQFCLLSCYFLVRGAKAAYVAYLINFSTFVVYCMLLGERDFIFIIMSITFHRLLIGELRLNMKVVVCGILFLYGATYIFNNRLGEGSVTLADMLNQGSLLFINTTILHWVPTYMSFRHGSTYLNSILSLLPTWIYQHDVPLTQWFLDQYALGSTSGYGFALDAEAYLNFGYSGVLVMFAVLALMQRALSNRLDRHPFFAYLSVFYTGFLMYAFRNDSFGLVRGIVTAGEFFAVVYVCSQVVAGHRVRKKEVRPALPDAGSSPARHPAVLAKHIVRVTGDHHS